MIPAGFVQALVTRAELKGALGTQELSDLLDQLFDRIAQKKGKELVGTSINGKSFSFSVNMTVEEAFSAVADALREINPAESGGKIVQTSPNFSGLVR